MPQPLVSICVPTCNRAAFLRESLKSIQGQDYPSLEIVISDNASEDETQFLCEEAARSDPRIRYFRQSKNIGLYGNHNFCLEASRGEFLCFFHDHDDRDPRIVSRYVEFLKRHPEAEVVCSDWELSGEAGEPLGLRRYAVAEVTPGLVYIEQTLRSGRSSIAAPGAMIRRARLEGIRFDEDRPIGFGDFVVWFRLAERGAIGHIPEILWKSRQERRAQSTRTIVSMSQDYDINMNRYCDEHLARFPERRAMVGRWRRYIRRYLFWALAFEVGLHFRENASPPGRAARTLFEIFNYRLSPADFEQALHRMRLYRTGLAQYAVCWVMKLLIRSKATRPLVWATSRPGLFRSLLKLRE
ncbi:MAG: glycosyltransferase family 2 protein [Candidatus Omnitrophica bacterium]|nr:glycosyltransferase family 2 protein [Candidatus Omnitrophota bacterium]